MFIDLLINPFIVALYSLLVGSFLNVCIFRIPFGRPKGLASLEMEEEEIEKQLEQSNHKINVWFPKRSFCPECKELLRWFHNIPIFSWVFLKGRCSFCKSKISFRYPLVELLSLIFAMLCYFCFSSWTAVIIYVFCCAMIVISFIDIDYYIIPNVISFPGMAIGLVIAIINHFTGFFHDPISENIPYSLLGFVAGGGFLFLISKIYEGVRNKVGLGFGDVKLMAMAGLFFGPAHALQAIFIGSFVGSIFGFAQIALSKKGMEYPIPFGPYLALGVLISIFTNVNLVELVSIR